MAFLDYPFDSEGGGNDNWQRFPHHSKVLKYLKNFSKDFRINPHIKFHSKVIKLEKLEKSWAVHTKNLKGLGESKERFDAVIVCNGHYTKPRIPALPGRKYFFGQMIHSHNYRSPSPMTNKQVALWGTSASGFDLSAEIDKVAAKTYWCGSAFAAPTSLNLNRNAYPSPSGFTKSGQLIVGTETLKIDIFVYCTGYLYDFPFIDTNVVNVNDNWVNPLYQDIVPPRDNTIGFIGLTYLVIPFPMFEIQAKWFVKQLKSKLTLKEASFRLDKVQERYKIFKDLGIARRHYHRLGDKQFEYYNLLAKQSEEAPIPEWLKQTWIDIQRSREVNPLNFRDMDLPVRGPTICDIR
jgi:hypothetical protein